MSMSVTLMVSKIKVMKEEVGREGEREKSETRIEIIVAQLLSMLVRLPFSLKFVCLTVYSQSSKRN